MYLVIDVRRMVFSLLFGMYILTNNSITCSGLSNNFDTLNLDRNFSFKENKRSPIQSKQRTSRRFSLTNVQKFFGEIKTNSDSHTKWFETFEIYVKNLDKPLNSLTGVICVERFYEIENIIKFQGNNCQSFISNCFFEENSTDAVIILAKFTCFFAELNRFIEIFDLIQYHWERLQNEIIDACKAKMAKIERILANISQTDIFLENILERKKKQIMFEFSEFDNLTVIEYKNLIKEYELKSIYNKFKENEFKHVLNYISFFSNSFRNVADKLKKIEMKTATSSPEKLFKIREDLFNFFRIFDSNEEDTILNLIKKVKEMNVYLYEELEKYEKRYSSFLKKLEDFIPRLMAIEKLPYP